jgi:hypothetical protein
MDALTIAFVCLAVVAVIVWQQYGFSICGRDRYTYAPAGVAYDLSVKSLCNDLQGYACGLTSERCTPQRRAGIMDLCMTKFGKCSYGTAQHEIITGDMLSCMNGKDAPDCVQAHLQDAAGC